MDRYEEESLGALDLNQQGVALMKAGNMEAAKAKYNAAIELKR